MTPIERLSHTKFFIVRAWAKIGPQLSRSNRYDVDRFSQPIETTFLLADVIPTALFQHEQ